MRRIARFFIVLFCLTFLANQAVSQDDLLTETVIRLLKFTTKGFIMTERTEEWGRKNLVVLDTRLDAIENYLTHSTDYKKPDVSEKGAEALAALMLAGNATAEFGKVRDDFAAFLKQLGH